MRWLRMPVLFACIPASFRLRFGFHVVPAYGPVTRLPLHLLGETVDRFAVLPPVIAVPPSS